MGKDLKGKELGRGICQQSNGMYVARFTDRFGERKSRRFTKLQECRKWIAEAKYSDEHTDATYNSDVFVDSWFEYWISIKELTVRPNTVRNYKERYNRNIKSVIGKRLLSEVKPIHCQTIFTKMAKEGYRNSTIYQTRITLYNMLEFAKENEVIRSNPCKRSVKSDIGKETEKKEALTIENQKKFLKGTRGRAYENAYRFILQTGLRTGELVALTWEDIDFEKHTLKIERSMEFRHSVGEWRVGPPKSKSGYRTIPLTEEAINILKRQKEKIVNWKLLPKNGKIIFFCVEKVHR